MAQGKAHIDLGAPGDYDIWISDTATLPPAAMKVKEASVDLPIPAGELKSQIFIWDHKTGNVATKSVGALKDGWKLKPEDFSLAGKTIVRIEHDGQPVAVAFVKVMDGAGSHESQIDPTKKGEAVFFGLKPGAIDITVRYNLKGQDAKPVTQTFALDAKRKDPDQTFAMVLTDDVETVSTTPPAAGDKPEAGKETSTKPSDEKAKETGGGGSLIGSIIVYLLALGAAGAVVYYGLRYMKANQDKVSDQLKKIGVQIPDTHDPSQVDPGPVAAPLPPAPPQKIILDDADPNIPAPVASVPMSPSPSVPVSEPSLIMENGDVFPIPAGETSVGREASNGLSLVAESTVSRRHAVLVRTGNDVVVRDAGSSNGTFVNGVQVSSDTPLRPGDQVQFGQVRFRYEA